MTIRFFRVCMVALFFCVHLTGCETAKKLGQVIANPDVQVGKLAEQPSEITVTLLTEPDTNINADGEAASVDVQLIYMSDDSKLQATDYDQIASTALPDVLGKNYIDHQDFSLLPDTIKTLPPVKLDGKLSLSALWPIFLMTRPPNGNKLNQWKAPAIATACWYMYGRAASK